jgi:hypothetical protein
LLAHGWWFSLGTPASATTKTGRLDITEILLKMALKHQKSIIQSINHYFGFFSLRPLLLVSLDYPFLLAPSVFSNFN